MQIHALQELPFDTDMNQFKKLLSVNSATLLYKLRFQPLAWHVLYFNTYWIKWW